MPAPEVLLAPEAKMERDMASVVTGLINRGEGTVQTKIVLLVLDGLGGLARQPGGKTELESARSPNMDALAAASECGLHNPIGIGIPPGSAPGHLSLFGYDPVQYPIGRGVVAALGIGFPIAPGDVAIRVNFCSLDAAGNITDRRAGRIPTEKCAALCALLEKIRIPGVEIFVRPVKDYRAAAIFRGSGLSDHVADTDPQQSGVPPLEPRGTSPQGKKMAELAKQFVAQARQILKNERSDQGVPTNGLLLRGFAELPTIPSMAERYGLKGVALAVYPDYKGVSRLVGMDVVEGLQDLKGQMAALAEKWSAYDYFFIHHKYTDSRGEDGDFDAKVAEIEKVDAIIPSIMALRPDVMTVTGDHSTPAVMKAHSGHPVPFLIHARETRPDGVKEFGETACASGLWGVIHGTDIIRLQLSYAGRIMKYGA
jgi:2,3-bisphosphoglycerate-independent phosphoglycerate mutase